MTTEIRQMREVEPDGTICYYQVELYDGDAPEVTPTGMKPRVKYLHRSYGPAVISCDGLIWDFYLYGVKSGPTYVRPAHHYLRHLWRLPDDRVPKVDMFGNPIIVTSQIVKELGGGSLWFKCQVSARTIHAISQVSGYSVLKPELLEQIRLYPDGSLEFPGIYRKRTLDNGDIQIDINEGYPTDHKIQVIKPNGDIWHYSTVYLPPKKFVVLQGPPDQIIFQRIEPASA